MHRDEAEQRELDLETLRADIEERYAYTQLGSGTVGGTFGEILCHELHMGNDPQPAGLHFGLIAEKWGMDLHTLGRLIADHCDKLQDHPPAEQRDDPMHCRSCGNSEEHCFDQRQRGLVCCYGCNHRPAEQRESARERIVAAAIQDGHGVTNTMPPPARHHTLIHAMANRGDSKPITGTQGFITSAGRFVRRAEAMKIAVDAGQVREADTQNGIELFSEDVW